MGSMTKITNYEPLCFGYMTEPVEITNIIFSKPATIVFWSDGTKTVVKCSENDTYVPEIGIAMAICKRIGGGNWLKKLVKKYGNSIALELGNPV